MALDAVSRAASGGREPFDRDGMRAARGRIDEVLLAELNQQAHAWMEKVNHQVHSTTREVPYQRLPQERLLLLDEFPDYDTSYMEDRRVAKDCMLSYRGNRYSVPFRFAGKTVLVREPVAGGRIEIYSEIKVIAEHRLAEGRGAMVVGETAPTRTGTAAGRRAKPSGVDARSGSRPRVPGAGSGTAIPGRVRGGGRCRCNLNASSC